MEPCIVRTDSEHDDIRVRGRVLRGCADEKRRTTDSPPRCYAPAIFDRIDRESDGVTAQ
jgi:hypothetical protein